MAWIKTLVKFPEKCPSTMAARGRSTERVNGSYKYDPYNVPHPMVPQEHCSSASFVSINAPLGEVSDN
jgi:hypothetical protein